VHGVVLHLNKFAAFAEGGSAKRIANKEKPTSNHGLPRTPADALFYQALF
jgi:hypothetical protein